MNTFTSTAELTIVIPAKNEAKLIPRLLTSLTAQDYSKMRITPVLVADANSTDGTPDIVRSFADRLTVEVIAGGMPAVGRNRGAAMAATRYVLFLDADIELAEPWLIRRCLEKMQQKQLHLATTNILCQGNFADKILYWGSDFFQYLSCIYKPFATGMFMLFDREHFHELGGFHEEAQFAEDYLLSQKVARRKFAIVRGGVFTTNRRFQKMGHLRVFFLFFRTALNTHNERFYLRDHKYWGAYKG
jgi:glycosyltransferase involved in cell wall biosynthesis